MVSSRNQAGSVVISGEKLIKTNQLLNFCEYKIFLISASLGAMWK